jgi:hypothetical protein
MSAGLWIGKALFEDAGGVVKGLRRLILPFPAIQLHFIVATPFGGALVCNGFCGFPFHLINAGVGQGLQHLGRLGGMRRHGQLLFLGVGCGRMPNP